MAGRFITLEGIEGVGKSTNLAFVEHYCRERGADVLVTREPGGTPTAEKIRDLILASTGAGLPDLGELLLMFAARAVHLEELVRPALAAGKTVICDRFTDATFAYQGGGRGMSAATIATLQELVQGELRPDLTLLLDAPVELSVQRVSNRGNRDRFEQEEAAFFRRVRETYLGIASGEPDRVKIVDATRSLAEVQADIAGHLSKVFSA